MSSQDHIHNISVYLECVDRGNVKHLDFDIEKQISLSAKLIESLRSELHEEWDRLENDNMISNQKEIKNLVKHIIRISNESIDFPTTIDFITIGALDILKKLKSANNGVALKKHLYQWNELSHEHMVPGEAVFNELIKENAKIFDILNLLSYRTLVTGPNRKDRENEVRSLDKNYQSTLPETIIFENKREISRKEIEMCFFPLLRYEAVGIIDNLIPISSRAVTLLEKYKAYVDKLSGKADQMLSTTA